MYTYAKCECQQCGKKILVERVLIGSDHTSDVLVTCLDCLMKKGLNENYKKMNPNFAKDIEDWYNTSIETIKKEEER